MIDSLLKVIEKSIDLINAKQNNDKQYFELIVKPLFIDFEKVAAEYFKLFSARGINANEAEGIRNVYLQSRIKITELAKIYQEKSKNTELIDFFKSVSEFFYGNFYVPEEACRSDGLYYINILTGERKFSSFVRKPKSLMEMHNALQDRWIKVVGIYGGLQFKYGTPIGYKV
jgi:hypothetical protein